MKQAGTERSLGRELLALLILCLLVWPMVATALIGAYGLYGWIASVPAGGA